MTFLVITLSWHSSWLIATVRDRFTTVCITFVKILSNANEIIGFWRAGILPEGRKSRPLSQTEVPERWASDGKSLHKMVKCSS